MRLPKKVKLYESQAWLTRQLVTLGKKPEQVAQEQSVTVSTIYRMMERHGIK